MRPVSSSRRGGRAAIAEKIHDHREKQRERQSSSQINRKAAAAVEQRLRGRVVQDLQEALRRLTKERYVVRGRAAGPESGSVMRLTAASSTPDGRDSTQVGHWLRHWDASQRRIAELEATIQRLQDEANAKLVTYGHRR